MTLLSLSFATFQESTDRGSALLFSLILTLLLFVTVLTVYALTLGEIQYGRARAGELRAAFEGERLLASSLFHLDSAAHSLSSTEGLPQTNSIDAQRITPTLFSLRSEASRDGGSYSHGILLALRHREFQKPTFTHLLHQLPELNCNTGVERGEIRGRARSLSTRECRALLYTLSRGGVLRANLTLAAPLTLNGGTESSKDRSREIFLIVGEAKLQGVSVTGRVALLVVGDLTLDSVTVSEGASAVLQSSSGRILIRTPPGRGALLSQLRLEGAEGVFLGESVESFGHSIGAPIATDFLGTRRLLVVGELTGER